MFLNFLPLLPIGLVLCFAAMRFWGTAILGVLLWAMVEGAARKWLLPEFQSQVLFVKDFILIFAYIGYFMSRDGVVRLGQKSATLAFLLLIEAVFCSMQLINPNSPSMLLSILGLKNYLIYLPLAFIVPDIITDRIKLRRLLLRACYIAIPISLLGLYQFSQPPASWVNQYVSHEEGVEATVSLFGQQEGDGDFKLGRARTSSTFSYIGGYMTFLLLAVPLGASLLLAAVPKRRTMLIVTAALALSIAGAATTGSRTPMVVYALSLPLLLLLSGWKGLLPIVLAVRLAAGGAVVGLLTVAVFGNAFSALEYRANTADSTVKRLMSPVTETLSAFETSPIIGTGLGTNSNAASILLGSDYMWWLDGNLYELETARVMQELGFMGFMFVFLPKLFTIVLIFSFLRQSKSRLTIATYMTALVFVLVHLILFTVNNPTGGLMYWAIVGVAIAAYRIERAERLMAEESAHYIDYGVVNGELSLG